jgi:hypothetical protein
VGFEQRVRRVEQAAYPSGCLQCGGPPTRFVFAVPGAPLEPACSRCGGLRSFTLMLDRPGGDGVA